jgi:hypothetical protein
MSNKKGQKQIDKLIKGLEETLKIFFVLEFFKNLLVCLMAFGCEFDLSFFGINFESMGVMWVLIYCHIKLTRYLL